MMTGPGRQRGNRQRRGLRALMFGVAVACAAMPAGMMVPGVATAQDRQPPYWASINRPEAIMRRGPSTQMRAMWSYRRLDLPVRIIAVRGDWRQVQDPDGITGWMHKRLLSGRRTAIVTGDMQPMHVDADDQSPVAYRAETGVVGRLGECRDGWCEFDVRGRYGWISVDGIWGD